MVPARIRLLPGSKLNLHQMHIVGKYFVCIRLRHGHALQIDLDRVSCKSFRLFIQAMGNRQMIVIHIPHGPTQAARQCSSAKVIYIALTLAQPSMRANARMQSIKDNFSCDHLVEIKGDAGHWLVWLFTASPYNSCQCIMQCLIKHFHV